MVRGHVIAAPELSGPGGSPERQGGDHDAHALFSQAARDRMDALKKTALHEHHRRLGARLVDFAGWEMPIQYASQLDEHHAVRTHAGMFDVAHMVAVDLHGASVRAFLSKLLMFTR